MNRKEEIAYNYLNSIYDGYKKSGRRPTSYGNNNEVYYSYEKNGDKSFEYDWINAIIKIKSSDYNAIRYMFELDPYQILRVYKQFVFDKIGDERIFNPDTRFDLQLMRTW
jgi:hypothetical protein